MIYRHSIAAAVLLLCLWLPAAASIPFQRVDPDALERAFADAEKIDLRTSTVESVVKLRDVVGIPPPETPVLVKTFKRGSLPEVLAPAFANPGVAGVTIAGRYVAIIHTDLRKEYNDVLAHELVHAYITLASPKPLPFWFQEGSAVHFSTDKPRKFYGQPSEEAPGVMVGREVELTDSYRQKLNNFHYLMNRVGQERFYQWVKEAVETGEVDARPLLGLPPREEAEPEPEPSSKPFPAWLAAAVAAAVIGVGIAGYFSLRTGSG